MSKLRVIVFDFDGVILESANVKTEAFVELYAAHGDDVTRRVREHHLANLGISRFKKFAWIAENILGTSITPEESKVLGEKFSALALDRVLGAPFVKGAEEALAALCASHRLFVASGTPQEELDRIVAHRRIAERFLEVHGTPREKPVILDDVMKRHGVTREETLFVGDGMSDYNAAVAVGVEFLARDTPELHDDWMKLGVRRVEDLSTLPEVIASW